MRDDERRLLEACLEGDLRPRYVAEAQGMPWKRLRYLCERKWIAKGFYDYGVVCDLGWFDHEKANDYLDRSGNEAVPEPPEHKEQGKK